MENVDTLFVETIDISKSNEQTETKFYSDAKSNIESYLYDTELLSLLRPMLIGPAKRTLEAVQTMMNYLQERYGVHISMRECMEHLKTLHFN